MQDIVRVRFAPSPTGIPHVGNIRTALFDYFQARAFGGEFILRIEDTDQARKIDEAEKAIKESLIWLGATWDEYAVQSERLDVYKKYADELVSQGKAKEEEGAIRFIVPKDDGVISWRDAVGGGREISFNARDIEDFIILKKDGYPTYHLANVIDDHLMNITHVIRGEDWVPSTPKHLMLYKAFGWEEPIFAHVPNVLGKDKIKLSKRRGAKSVLDFKNEGYLPEALLNYLMLLGWSPKDDREILSKEEIEKEFTLEKINAAPAIFDIDKLKWMNGMYIREKTNEDIEALLKEYYVNEINVLSILSNNDTKGAIIELAKTRMDTLADFISLVTVDKTSDREAVDLEISKQLTSDLSELSNWTKDEIFAVFKRVMEKNSIRMPVLYKLFTGRERGLPLPDFLEALGRESSLERLSE